jgi:hypothetical protein
MMLFLLDQLAGEFQCGPNVVSGDSIPRCTSSKVMPPARLPTTMATGSRSTNHGLAVTNLGIDQQLVRS